MIEAKIDDVYDNLGKYVVDSTTEIRDDISKSQVATESAIGDSYAKLGKYVGDSTTEIRDDISKSQVVTESWLIYRSSEMK